MSDGHVQRCHEQILLCISTIFYASLTILINSLSTMDIHSNKIEIEKIKMLICIICTCIRHITGLHAYANGKTKFGISLILYNSFSNHNYVSLVKKLYQSIPFPPPGVMADYYGL